MSSKTVRLFVGNLPPDTVEDDLKRLLKKYATVSTVEIKRRINDVFAFVDLENLKFDVNTCLQELSWKQWKGQQLNVQRARESFLQRLARERLENSVSVKKENEPLESQPNINNIKNGPEPWKNSAVNTVKINQKVHKNDDNESSDSTDSSDSEVPSKGGLQMFRGTAILQKKSKSPQKIPNDKISTNKINEEKEILETFEMFNDVWKDEPSEVAVKKTTNHYAENRNQKQKAKASLRSSLGVQDHECTQMDEDLIQNEVDIPVTISQIKQAEAEERRLKALADRKKEILNKKHAIQFALASVDSRSIVNRPNKKIIFNDDNAAEGETRNSSSYKEPKLTLFSDDEMEQETDNNDFRIRKQYEGEKGKTLLSLQARYGNDKRFVLDERFIESDDEQERGEEGEVDDTQAEREKALRILGNVLGKEIPEISRTKTKQTAKLMLRYDPSKPDHTKFEIKDSGTHKKKKKKTAENEAKSKEEILPVVSKERYYQVSETLRETLENKNQQFSLSAIFGEENESGEKENEVNLEAKPIIGKKDWPLKHFQNESSASEDENETNDQIVPRDHSEENIGVRQESLFFEKNDARFTEGLEFINFNNEEYIKNFHQIRYNVKTLIKHKIQNHKKDSERQRRKFGKRIKNSFPAKRVKNNIRR